MNKIYFSIGSNIGDRLHYMEEAIRLININVGKVTSRSSMYETEGWGIKDQPKFLNAVVEIESTRFPSEILKITQKIEYALGKSKKEKWGPRNIDIDILYYGNEIFNEEGLVIPHPHISERKFVLKPMSEIAPDWVDPVSKKTIQELLTACEDSGEIYILETELLNE